MILSQFVCELKVCWGHLTTIKKFFFNIFSKTEEEESLDPDYSPGFQQKQLLEQANNSSFIDDKDVILAAQETHDYYSDSNSIDFNTSPQKIKKKSKIKTEPKTPRKSDVQEGVQFVRVVQDPVVVREN